LPVLGAGCGCAPTAAVVPVPVPTVSRLLLVVVPVVLRAIVSELSATPVVADAASVSSDAVTWPGRASVLTGLNPPVARSSAVTLTVPVAAPAFTRTGVLK
jgi:hypothetical protein